MQARSREEAAPRKRPPVQPEGERGSRTAQASRNRAACVTVPMSRGGVVPLLKREENQRQERHRESKQARVAGDAQRKAGTRKHRSDAKNKRGKGDVKPGEPQTGDTAVEILLYEHSGGSRRSCEIICTMQWDLDTTPRASRTAASARQPHLGG